MGVHERTLTTFPLMGTSATLCTLGEGDTDIAPAVVRRLRDLEARLTVNGPVEARSRSQVEAVNLAAGVSAVAVDAEVYSLLRTSVRASREHRGSFNALIGPVVKAWGIGFADARVPSAAEIEGLLALTDPDEVELEDESRTVALHRVGMRLDLGAIAKGYAADVAAAMLRQAGLPGGLIDLGGNVVAVGTAEGGRPWRVGIQSPFAGRGAIIGHLSVQDTSVVTSGIYERVLEAGGRRFHHMIDPLTGYPFETDLASVTVVAASSLDADLWATVAQRGGLAGGFAAVSAEPGIEAVFVTLDRRVVATAGCRGQLTLTDRAFSLG